MAKKSTPPRKKNIRKTIKKKTAEPMRAVEARPDLLEQSIAAVSPREQLGKRFEDNLKNPKISVIVVNRNGVDLLRHSLFALQTQSYPWDEIILAGFKLTVVREIQETAHHCVGLGR